MNIVRFLERTSELSVCTFKKHFRQIVVYFGLHVLSWPILFSATNSTDNILRHFENKSQALAHRRTPGRDELS